MGKNVFLSYSDETFRENRDALCASAEAAGFDLALRRAPEDLERDFREIHSAILSERRGAGYWLWKPQIILQELQQLGPEDVLVYSDAGRSSYYHFSFLPERLLEKARKCEFIVGVLVPQHGPLSRWTKRDALVLLNMDRKDVWTLPTIQATWSIWTKSDKSMNFLRNWIELCCDPAALTDAPNVHGKPNLPDFIDHRHDQALATLLAYRDSAVFLDYRRTWLFQVLRLRPQSNLAHQFLKRLDDAERMERGELLRGLAKSFVELRTLKS